MADIALSQQINSVKNPEHKKHLQAIATALTDLIREKDAEPTPTAYFALLCTSLLEGRLKTLQETSAILKLITILLPQISDGVLRKKFSILSNALMQLIEKNLNLTALLKQVAVICGYLIKAQDHKASWSYQPNLLSLFQTLLGLSIDSRPKIRKATHEAIQIIGESNNEFLKKEISSPTAQTAKTLFSSAAPNNFQNALHFVLTLKVLLPLLDSPTILSLSQTMLDLLPKVRDSNFSSNVFSCLSILYEDKNVPSSCLNDLYEVILKVKTPTKDHTALIAHGQLVTKGLLALASTKHLVEVFSTLFALLKNDDSTLGQRTAENLKEIIQELVDGSLEEVVSGDLSLVSVSVLQQVVSVLEGSLSFGYQSQWGRILLLISTLFKKLGEANIGVVEGLLRQLAVLRESPDFPYPDQLNSALASALVTFGLEKFSSVIPLNLNSLDERPRVWVLQLFRKYVRGADMQYFTRELMPLAISLKQSGDPAHLKLATQIWDLFPSFCAQPLPSLIQNFQHSAKALGTALMEEEEGRLPLCNGLSRLINETKKRLEEGLQLSKRKLKQLQKQQLQEQQAGEDTTLANKVILSQEEASSILKSLAVYSKNFLPCLFNLLAPTSPVNRPIILRAIEAYVSITDSALVNNFFKSVASKLLEATTVKDDPMEAETDQKSKKKVKNPEADKIYFLSDLAVVFVEHLDMATVQFLYKIIKPFLEPDNKDHVLEKKGYKVLNRICEYHPQFVSSTLTQLKDLLIHSLITCSSSAKKLRLKALSLILDQLTTEDIISQVELISEIVLCVKESNAQARLAAYNLLLQIGYKVASLENNSFENNNDYPLNNEDEDQMEEDEDEEKEDEDKEEDEDNEDDEEMSQDGEENAQQEGNSDVLKEFYLILLAGLAGTTPHMVSASLEALSRITYEFKGTKLLRNQTYATELFETVLVLFEMNSKEIIQSLLGFCKVAIVSLPFNSYRSKLPPLLKGLGKWASLGRNRFRTKIKYLLERCIKKFGYDIVEKHLPAEHHKLIIKLKKQSQKQQKKKAQKLQEKNDKEHDKRRHRQKEEGKEKGSKKKDKLGVLLPDQDDAEIIDFLDPNALNQVKRSKYAKAIEEEEDEEVDDYFPTNDSGKIVVSEEKSGFGKDKKKPSSQSSAPSSNSFSGGKRKRGRDEENDHQKPSFKQNKASKNAPADAPHSGKQYSTKKAKGDMLRPGKLEPYAYLPLQPKFLNKRKKAQSVKQFAAYTKKGK